MMQYYHSCILAAFCAVFALANLLTLPATKAYAAGEEDLVTASASLPVPDPKPAFEMKSYKGDMASHLADYEDTLLTIARKNSLGYVEIRSANPGVDPWIPGEGKEIILPTRHLLPSAPRNGIVINLPEMRLFAFIDADSDPISYPIGIGREGLKTPIGTTRIIKKKDEPTWFPTQRMRDEDPELPRAMGPGPDNPLGTHALYLGWPTFLIHGTSEPWGIGRRVSSGCIRLYPEDIIKLFEQVDTGTSVTIVDQPIKAGWIDGKLYVEAHVSQIYSDTVEETGAQPPYDISSDDLNLILDVAGDDAEHIDWYKVRRIIGERRGYPLAVTRKLRSAHNNSSSNRAQERNNLTRTQYN